MNTSPFASLHNDLVDHVTGLPRYASALVEIPHLARRHGERSLGIVAFSVVADATLLRLTPEAAQLLRADITRRLTGLLQGKDRLYSMSHWEWLAVLPDLPGGAPVHLAMMRLQGSFMDPLPTLDGLHTFVTQCGGALWPDDGEDALHLVQSARIARLAAAAEPAGHALYRPEFEQASGDQRALHADLRNALSDGTGLALHLQPQIDLASGACVGAEALLRLRRKDGLHEVPPRVLAGIERLGLRKVFNRWLLQQAMQTQERLTGAGVALTLAINLTANDLLDSELPDLMAQSLATWAIPAASLRLELTETSMIEETEPVIEVLQRLRTLGVDLAIDDFGTGYAGMSYLQRLPVQEVKIDQSFVRNAAESKRDREIIAAVVRLAHRLKMRVLAEGVESSAVAAAVAHLGCDLAQGFHYAAALPLDEFIPWWRQRHERFPPPPPKPVRRRRRSPPRKAK
ncbi:MAG: EAL domain-containing protein [Azonexus sp.]|nr:EAL domain-containing protein [Betaproteobacteria bacterium]MBP6037208.1 EAL domain-containing protein [Azonexus sp.]MBP6907756.1 EAL domain-containing protein [Azonexus sp.]